jgi:hypothetical protein
VSGEFYRPDRPVLPRRRGMRRALAWTILFGGAAGFLVGLIEQRHPGSRALASRLFVLAAAAGACAYDAGRRSVR